MQPAYFLALISLATASVWAPPAVEHAPPAAAVMPSANAGNASEAEQDAALITGTIPAVLYRVTGEPLTCELIRLIDEVELIADENYCG
jgi:hypothetical protein